MSASLNNIATQDRYAAETTLTAPRTRRLNITAGNAAVYYQLGRGQIPAFDEPETLLVPGVHNFDRRCDAVRVRSAAPGASARVTIEALTRSEVGDA